MRERIASMQTRWQTEALNAISDAETRWKKAEKERIDAARKEWQEEKERILKDMATAVPAVDLESHRHRADAHGAGGAGSRKHSPLLPRRKGGWKTEEAARLNAARAEWQKELDQRVKESGSIDIDPIVQKKVAAAQQKWQEEFIKVLEDTEKRWKAGEAERLKEAQAQWESNAGKGAAPLAGPAAWTKRPLSSASMPRWRSPKRRGAPRKAQRLKSAEKEWGREAEKKYATLELRHIEDLQKLHAAEAKLVELRRRAQGCQGTARRRAGAPGRRREGMGRHRREAPQVGRRGLEGGGAAAPAGRRDRLEGRRAKRLEDARDAEWLATASPQPRTADAIDASALEQHSRPPRPAGRSPRRSDLQDAEAAWRSAEQKRLDEAHVLWQSQTERRFSLIEKQVKDYQTQQAGITDRQVAEKLAAAAETWKIEGAARLSAARAAWESQNGRTPPSRRSQKLAAQEEKIRIRVADELVEAQRFWQEAADLKLQAERAQWQAETERRVTEAKGDPELQARLIAETERRIKAEHAREMDGMQASVDAMMTSSAQRLEKEHSQRMAVAESQWRNSMAQHINEARAAATAEAERRIADLTRERDEALSRVQQQQPAAAEAIASADRVTLEIKIAQLETERDAAVRRAEDAQRNLALREEAQSRLSTQNESQLAAAIAAERMKWQAEAEQRVANERREKEQAIELLKLAEARLRAMPTAIRRRRRNGRPRPTAGWRRRRPPGHRRGRQQLQAAEAKWKTETDQRFAIAEEMFKEIYEERLETVETKWRADRSAAHFRRTRSLADRGPGQGARGQPDRRQLGRQQHRSRHRMPSTSSRWPTWKRASWRSARRRLPKRAGAGNPARSIA